MRLRWRWLNCLYAFVWGYFWLPCPLCGRKFGGHERGGSLYCGYGTSVGVCPDCSDEAKRRNAEYFTSEAWRQEQEDMSRRYSQLLGRQ